MTQMKEQNKTPEKELNKMEITKLSDAEFKIMVIRTPKELPEYRNSIKKTQAEMMVKWKKEKSTGNQRWREGNWDSNQQFGEGRNKHSTRTEWRIEKNEERHRNLWDNFKHSNIWIIRVPEVEEEQEIENLFEKNEGKLP